MSWKAIVVHVDSSQATNARLQIATRLAATFGARLVGVHARYFRPAATFLEVAAELIEAEEQWVAEEAETSRKLFQQAAAAEAVPAEWRETQGDPVRVLTMQARYGDLLVVGQEDPDKPTFHTPATLVEDLIFAAGRPLLVVPYIGAPATFRNILVAWNASREAARAIGDALPLLTRAERVTVLAVNPMTGLDGHGEMPCADICQHLARHGVRAEAAHVRAEDIDAGNVLLSQAADRGSDLLVMGAYGHSRMRELVLGGATRTILRHMTVPVLLSH